MKKLILLFACVIIGIIGMALIGDSTEPENEAKTPSGDEKTEPTSSSKEEVQNENPDVALEAVFPVENAKRSAVVAITNSLAMDVFAEDRSTYDVSKFHSYEDTSGDVYNYFMKVNSWGTWSAKGEQTWHVDSLELGKESGIVVNAELDVNFDGTNYVVSNIKGTYGNPGASADNLINLSEIESGSTSPIYLTVSPKLIENNRDQAKVDALDQSDKLDKYVARKAFDRYGKSLFPYGFKSHWIVDLRNEEQTPEGSWIFKVGVTITNEYGVEVKAIAEGLVSGETDNPIVEEFYAN